jgi:hypothetical protein
MGQGTAERITKIDLQEAEWEDMDWIHLDQNTDHGVGSCANGDEPLGCIRAGKNCD